MKIISGTTLLLLLFGRPIAGQSYFDRPGGIGGPYRDNGEWVNYGNEEGRLAVGRGNYRDDDDGYACYLPAAPGPCYAYFPRWFYNSDTNRCEEFVYGGCQGNSNNFDTRRECLEYCGPDPEPPKERTCTIEPDSGPCRGSFPRWFYDADSDVCRRFTYGGCRGNSNNFLSRDECRETCSLGPPPPPPRPVPPIYGPLPPVDICELDKKTGPCRASMQRWYYNSNEGECQKFVYGGCQGNDNNFKTKSACQNACDDHRPPPPPPPKDVCELPADGGPCEAYMPRYFYNYETERCEEFIYGGCQGNRNNFKTKDECRHKCSSGPPPRPLPPPKDICDLRAETGPCRAAIDRWFYNSKTERCEEFVYGGCEGNENNFMSRKECIDRCDKSPPPPPPPPPPPHTPDFCKLEPRKGPCKDAYDRWYYDYEKGHCDIFTYSGCGGNKNKFRSQDECESTCSSHPPPPPNKNVCEMRADPGPCRGSFERWAYNANKGRCETFIYGGCQGNMNRFETKERCLEYCDPAPPPPPEPHPPVIDACDLPAETGRCRAAIPRWFYNSDAGGCEMFVYGGCDGNDNNFETRRECQRSCSTYTPPNKNVCELRPDEGPCRGSFQRWYFNAKEGRCMRFTYGGCAGNNNNFETKRECEEHCDYTPSQEDW